FHLLAHGARLDRAQRSVGLDKRARDDESAHLVHRVERLACIRVPRNVEVVGVRGDIVQDVLGPTLVAQHLDAAHGMQLSGRPRLVVPVVDEAWPRSSSSSTSPSTCSMASSIPASAPADLVVAATVARPRERQRTARLAAGGGVFVLVLALVAVAAPWLAPQDPERTSLRVRLVAPTLEAADGRAHALGTDHLGRDVLSRLVYGARVSLIVGFAAVVVGGLVGSALGVVAGFRRGWLDTVVMTLADAQLAFPFILLAIGIIAVLGPSFPTLILVIGLSGWVSYARVLRAQVLGLRTREFVDAVQAL